MLDGLLVTSKHLITALEKADWLDRMLVFAGLAFFVLVVVFILKQRLVDRGLRIAFWWTRFIPDFGGDERLLDMEEAKAASAVTGSIASVVASVSAAAASISASAGMSSSSFASTITSAASEPHPSHPEGEAPTGLETLSDTLLASPAPVDGALETGLHDEL